MKALGFRENTQEGAPLCRWCQQTTTLDVMSLDGKILGFKNRWYGPAMETAEERDLEPDLDLDGQPVEHGRDSFKPSGYKGRDSKLQKEISTD